MTDRKRYTRSVITVHISTIMTRDPIISFSDEDYKGIHSEDIPEIDSDFMCYLLASGALGVPEKEKARRKEETCKLFAARFIREILYPTTVIFT
ncbi:hypothetical protein CR513_25811, partial [Mucuna pruriens]